MDYKVRFVADGDMPGGHMWALCRTIDTTTLYLAESTQALSAQEKERALEQAWASFRSMTTDPLPGQRPRPIAV